MTESKGGVQWGWRCAGHGCGAREQAPARSEVEAARVAAEHSRWTGHLVSWGLLMDGRIR